MKLSHLVAAVALTLAPLTAALAQATTQPAAPTNPKQTTLLKDGTSTSPPGATATTTRSGNTGTMSGDNKSTAAQKTATPAGK